MDDFKRFKKQRILDRMEEEGLSLLISSLPQNTFYCVDYRSITQTLMAKVDTFSMFDPTRGVFSLVAPCSEIPTVIEQIPDVKIYAYGKFFFHFEKEDPLNSQIKRTIDQASGSSIEALKKAITESGLEKGRVGLDDNRIRPAQWGELVGSFSRLKFIPANDIFYQIRMIKHKEEVRRLEKAAEIAEESLYHLISVTKPGMSEIEMENIYLSQLVRRGAIPFFHVMTADHRSAYVDTINRSNRISNGSLIRLDVGCEFEGYKADMSRTAVVGKPSAKVKDYYGAIRAGVEKAVEAAKPGITASELFNLTLKETRKGLPQFQRYHVGHGIGLEIYDPPSISPETITPLEPGMVLCLETPYYEPGWGGVQVEDTILVTAQGSRGLTKTSRELVVIET